MSQLSAGCTRAHVTRFGHSRRARDGLALATSKLFAAIAEGAVSGGNLPSRAGAALAGLGFGLLYLGAGRRLAPALAARATFEIGALVLVGLRLL